ncbi:glycosyltransferase family 4 protein [Holdemanella porci]|uniref:glycosyltransferase family 4 protein n=1 Tax=Holdemanella porci TaxID=2652276 RepID=UPI003F8F4B86
MKKNRIVHIALSWPMMDELNYQDNLLPKYHARLGYDVTVISSKWVFDENGDVIYDSRDSYSLRDYDVIRLDLKLGKNVNSKIKIYDGLLETLCKLNPDILFVHEINFLDILKIKEYCKNHKVILYVDNHCDLKNSCKNFVSRYFLHGILWRYCAKEISPYVRKFYGVLPARVSFLTDIYHIEKSKCELLVMGADDDYVSRVKDQKKIDELRRLHKIESNDFLIVTGGKINSNRPETLNLMKAVKDSKLNNLKLIVFGTVARELEKEFFDLIEREKIIFVGWQDSLNTYQYMASANLVIFPGLHSVMWEQAVALGVPTMFRDIEGFHHVDLGGNCIFLKDVSVDGIKNEIENLINNPRKYHMMELAAKEKGMDAFSYKNIAKKSINLEDK